MRKVKEPLPTFLLFLFIWIFLGRFPLSADSAEVANPAKEKVLPTSPAGAESPKAASAAVIEMRQVSCSDRDLLDPMSGVWQTRSGSDIGLQPQTVVTPCGGGSIKSIKVKSARTASGVAFCFEWQDDTKDNDTVHQVKFRDAVAIEFPIAKGSDTVLAMGSPHGPVNIWQWKADWEPDAPEMNAVPYEKDVDSPSIGSSRSVYRRLHVDSPREANAAQGKGGPVDGVYNLFPQSAHKSPVEDIVAIGISSVTTKPERFQNLKGKGVWKNGSWHVVVYKPLSDKSDSACPRFSLGDSINTAIAVWNGSKQDRNGMKSLSNWVTLRVL